MPNYGESAYWNERYANAETEHFEWFCDFDQMESKVKAAVPDVGARVLVIGCGSSRLSGAMYDAGYESVTSIDISDVVIGQMQRIYKDKPKMQWAVMDARMMSFEANSFDFIIDKGTMDSLICGAHGEASALKLHHSIHKVLAPSGVYINVTYGEPAERMKHFNRPDFSWVTEHSTLGTYHIFKMTKPED